MHLCTHGKQGHMHSSRYCDTHIEIKLANAIVFLPRVAEPVWNIRQTLYKGPVGCVCSQFQPPKPRLKHSCVYAERIFINCNKLHFNPWNAFHRRNCLTGSSLARVTAVEKQKWEMMKAVVCFRFSSVMLVEISCDTGISVVALSCKILSTGFRSTFFFSF